MTVGDRTGELVVVSTPIGNLADLSSRAAASIEQADVVCCEDTRHTGQMLARLGLRAARLVSVHAHNERERVPAVLELLAKGARVALVSDAGTPTISDPGETLISAVIASGHKVTAVPGPSAALSALVVAGLGTARWRFEGFLPRRGSERAPPGSVRYRPLPIRVSSTSPPNVSPPRSATWARSAAANDKWRSVGSSPRSSRKPGVAPSPRLLRAPPLRLPAVSTCWSWREPRPVKSPRRVRTR